jgi:hypothetical protein
MRSPANGDADRLPFALAAALLTCQSRVDSVLVWVEIRDDHDDDEDDSSARNSAAEATAAGAANSAVVSDFRAAAANVGGS